MKAEARRVLTRWLKDVEAAYPEGVGLEGLPEMTQGQWRTIAAALQVYRAALDEKLIEADLRRPQISLSELSRHELRALCRPQVIDVTEEKAG